MSVPPARRWFWRGQHGFSHVFSEVGGQIQPGGVAVVDGPGKYGGSVKGGSHIGQPAVVRRQGYVMQACVISVDPRLSLTDDFGLTFKARNNLLESGDHVGSVTV